MKEIAGYRYLGYRIPARMAGALERWITHGVHPGGFLHAVLCNDLHGACSKADSENLKNLPAYVAYLYNHAPSGCWGSEEKVMLWKGRES